MTDEKCLVIDLYDAILLGLGTAPALHGCCFWGRSKFKHFGHGAYVASDITVLRRLYFSFNGFWG